VAYIYNGSRSLARSPKPRGWLSPPLKAPASPPTTGTRSDAGNIPAGGLGVVLISVVVAYLTSHPALASRVASIEEVPSCRCPPHQFRYSRLVSTRSRRSLTRLTPMPKRSRSTLRCCSTRASSPTCLH